jgi:hypothetical protein
MANRFNQAHLICNLQITSQDSVNNRPFTMHLAIILTLLITLKAQCILIPHYTLEFHMVVFRAQLTAQLSAMFL